MNYSNRYLRNNIVRFFFRNRGILHKSTNTLIPTIIPRFGFVEQKNNPIYNVIGYTAAAVTDISYLRVTVRTYNRYVSDS